MHAYTCSYTGHTHKDYAYTISSPLPRVTPPLPSIPFDTLLKIPQTSASPNFILRLRVLWLTVFSRHADTPDADADTADVQLCLQALCFKPQGRGGRVHVVIR